MTDHTKPTLVISGTGKTGRRVVERLEARGVPTRSGSRSADPPFDWEDTGTWAAALDGAGAAYVSYYPDIAIPGAVEAITGFAETALEQGVRRLVLLSGRGEEEAQRAERVVRESAPTGRSYVAAGSTRTSTRASSRMGSWQARWSCPGRRSRSRSSTWRTSPTLPRRR